MLGYAWALGLALTALASALMRRLAPSSLDSTARGLDRSAGAMNRLETAAELEGVDSPLAQAQRDETAAFLGRASPAIRAPWALPWLAAMVLALLVLHLAALATWVLPGLLNKASDAAQAPTAEQFPKASITWKSPEAEIQANPVEEVPTVALVESTTGLRGMALEVSVNGAPGKVIPLPATPFDRAGTNTLKASLYMDELGVEPFDVVSYFIRARRITGLKVPDTTSPIQFVQVRPFREDVRNAGNLDPDGAKNFNLLRLLKLAQLRSVKENFVLSTTDLPPGNPVRSAENDRVGRNESALAGKTDEIVQAFIQSGYPAEIIDLLQQAGPLMADASKRILAAQNVQALPVQERALNLIVQTEKFFQKTIAKIPPGAPEPPPDPFRDKQQRDMKKRSETPAGKLEQLAADQQRLSDFLSQSDRPDDAGQQAAETQQSQGGSGNGTPGQQEAPQPAAPQSGRENPAQSESGADSGTPAERQTRLLQGIDALLNSNTAFPAATEQALREARELAGKSLGQLDRKDEASAREPAAGAAGKLREAAAQMDAAGATDTRRAMEDGQRGLNDLQRQLDNLAKGKPTDGDQGLGDLAKKLGDVRRQLEDAADQQQEAGSADGARRLKDLVDSIGRQGIQKDLAAMAKADLDKARAADDARKAGALAAQAAQGVFPGKPSAQDLSTLLDSLEKSRANLERLARLAGGSQGSAQDGGGTKPGSKAGGQAPEENPAGAAPGQEDRGGSASRPDAGGSPPAREEPGAGSRQATGPGGRTETGESPGEKQQAPAGAGAGGDVEQAYAETMADISDAIQIVAAIDPNSTGSGPLGAVVSGMNATSRGASQRDIVRAYRAVALPMDKLIAEVRMRLAQAERQEVIRQPDMDEAPAAYRPSVSDYFEAMSRNYRPDGAGGEPAKP
jgi:hypothetical protein